MQGLWKLTFFLSCTWVVSLLYGEMMAFWIPLWTCSWPQIQKSPQMGDSIMNRGDMVKVAVIADPQLMDHTTLQLAPKSVVLRIVQFYTDLYMRRSFRASILPFRPDVILFLGDLFDGGPFLSDKEWHGSLSRLKHIFHLDQKGRASGITTYYLPGNHDIGYAGLHSHHPEAISRFEAEFGARNYHFSLGKVDFVVVDALTLDGPPKSHLTSTSWYFVQNASMDMLNPRVLLTHIPLYRADGTYCGPYRASPIINQRISLARADQGIMYQNYLTKETSNRLLELIRPVVVLSGHDHDQCTVIHQTSYGSVREQTVGTLSWQQGNLYPSFMLLSVNARTSNGNMNPEDAIIMQLCFLPLQTHIYVWYLFLLIASLLLLLFWPANGIDCMGGCNRFRSFVERTMPNSFKATCKDKNEDVSCEYDVIWDAECSMHLVRKSINAPPTTQSDLGPTGRGNAVMRPMAKKHSAQEARASNLVVNMELTATGDPGKLPARLSSSSKSKARVICQPVSSMFRLLLVIALLNIPLYMILLFKDWIDI